MANLVVMILIPLVLGIMIKSRSEPLAARIRPVVDWASNISIAVIFLTFGIIFLSRLREIVSTSSGAIAVVVAIVFTLAALGLTYLLGGLEKDARQDLAFGPARNATAALVVIFAAFTDMANDVLLMVLMVTIFAIIIVSILVGIIFKQRMDAEKKAKGSGA